MAKKVLPIKPNQVAHRKNQAIPSEVIEIFNELIQKDFDGSSARVVQDDVVKILVQKGFKRNEIFEKHMLDVEDVFAKSGWSVEYDKPAYNESYDAFFIFSIE